MTKIPTEEKLKDLERWVHAQLVEPIAKLDAEIKRFSPEQAGYDGIVDLVIDGGPAQTKSANTYMIVMHDVHTRIARARALLVGQGTLHEYPRGKRLEWAIGALQAAASYPNAREQCDDPELLKALEEAGRTITTVADVLTHELNSLPDEKTLVITTGGTIESFYNSEEGTPHYVPLPDRAEDTCIPAALEKMGLGDDVDTYPLAMKDSKEVTTDILDHVMWKAATEGYTRIVIVHGTDTMPVHARYLKRRMAEYGSEYGMDETSIVFTGAMGPLRDKHVAWREPETHTECNDGWHNLRRALQDVQTVKPGVYVEMGDGPHEADAICKNVEVDNPGSRTAKVMHSGFVADDPARHIRERF